jgi:hypothetical protein
VASVPFDVTGEGPTISLLGLIRWAELGLMKEFGRSDCGSVPDDELQQNSSQWTAPTLGAGWEKSYAIYCEESEGDSGPEERDISACAENAELILPVDDLKGASRAMALTPGRHRHSPGKGAKPEPFVRIRIRIASSRM